MKLKICALVALICILLLGCKAVEKSSSEPWKNIKIDPDWQWQVDDEKALCYTTLKEGVKNEFNFDFESLIFHRMRCEGTPIHSVQYEGEGITKDNKSFYVHFWATRHGGMTKCLIIGDELVAEGRRNGEQIKLDESACRWV